MQTSDTVRRSTPVRRNPTIPCRGVDGTCRFTPPQSVAVVVVCHNYGRFLAECLDSVLAQTHAPREILVVDDASDDDSGAVAVSYHDRGVRYMRVEYRNVHQVRRAGMEATRAEVLCFLDADDKLDPGYLQQGLRAFDEPNVAVVYSDLTRFGESDAVSHYPEELRREDIAPDNSAHAGSLVLREALIQSSPFDDSIDPLLTQADWFLWRRVLSGPWRARKQRGMYLYRMHSTNWTHSMRRVARDYFDYAGLAHETITLFVPLSGRIDSWEHCSQFLANQQWPHDQTRLILVDSSSSPEFSSRIRLWLAGCDYRDFRYLQRRVGRPGLADADRHSDDVKREVRLAMSKLYHLAATETVTDYVWILEDDIVPPLDACSRLLHGLDSHTASVSAVYCSRFDHRPCVWDQHRQNYQPIPQSLRAVHGNGFGCVILRGGVLRQSAFRHRDDFDRNFYDQLSAAGWIAKVDWTVGCRHGDVESPVVENATTGCTCPAAGWCERHQCRKSERWWQICRTRPGYFRLWEVDMGPGQQNADGDQQQEPGLLTKAWNLTKAIARHAVDGGTKVSEQTYSERLAICRGCASCDVPRMVCTEPECGCQLYVKARWRSEHCPKGNWPEPTASDLETSADAG